MRVTQTWTQRLPIMPLFNNTELSVLQWNINGFLRKRSYLLAIAQQYDFDIIRVPQETLLREEVRFPGYRTFSLLRSDTTRGCMVLVKDSLPCSEDTNPIYCGDGVEAHAVLVQRGHETFTIYNLYRGRHAVLDLGEVSTLAGDRLLILGGDFNANHPSLSSTQGSNAAGNHLHHTLTSSSHIALLNDGSPTHVRGGKLDLTLVAATLSSRARWEVHPVVTSDHFAVCTYIRDVAPPPVVPHITRWNTSKANWPLFSNALASWATEYNPSTWDVDSLEADLSTALHAAARDTIPLQGQPTRRHKNHWYYNEEMREANHRVYMFRRAFRRNRTQVNLANLRAAPRTGLAQQQLREERIHHVGDMMAHTDETDEEFTIGELMAAPRPDKDTASGEDGVTYSMLAHLRPAGDEAFLRVINASSRTGRLPTAWKTATIVPIPRPKEPGAYRPISLVSRMGKTAERMVLNRLLWKLDPLHGHIYAYRKGTGTAHSIATLLAAVSSEPSIAIFLDLEKASELAPLAIQDTLACKGVRGRLLTWIDDYLSRRSGRVRFQGHMSEPTVLENATPQGGVLSPTLFNVLISNVLKLPLPHECKIISYADDLSSLLGSNDATLIIAGK
ncbi:uncharacterized protein LOC143029087 [Oratosquilla oratoria]|uniref:uncharacterized protein LOC143029087 n=1 Tax=Oratosquilla oratoria TaxID=337810 RepID=UPI003F7721FB